MTDHIPEQVNTVIVGAGPIGLLNAIGLLTKNPERKVVMLEKYDEYKRNHTLRVDHKQIEKYLRACGEPPDPTILQLVQQTRKNGFIRISELERLLKARALELGAQIITNNGVTDFDEQVRKKYPNADLILGADGTRSVVSQQAIGKSYAFYEMTDQTEMIEGKMYFREIEGQLAYSVITPEGTVVKDKVLQGEQFKTPSPVNMKKINDMKKDILEEAIKNNDILVIENSEKREFDFVMQLRIEVEGDVEPIPFPTLMRMMQNYGTTADEYVGKKNENGMTPITFQLMITKEQFKILEAQAKSGDPIRPFSGTDKKAEVIPTILQQQITGYLGLRLRHFTKEEEIVRIDTATISVNEAPATYAKEVTKRLDDGTEPDVVVVGDASLGLSYFKGINAAFEASANLLEEISKPHAERQQGLNDYNTWFKEIYAPSKVDEVKFYSNYVINATVGLFKTLKFIFTSDFLMRADVAERTVDLYRGHMAHVNNIRQQQGDNPEVNLPKWQNAYEHNGRSLENVLTFRAENSSKALNNVGKNFIDMGKPYKSSFYFFRDLLAPARALYQATVGGLQIATALPIELVNAGIGMVSPGKYQSRSQILGDCGNAFLDRLGEGISRVLLAASLAATTLLMPFKLISRGALTFDKWYQGKPMLIEENKGIKKLVKQSDEILDLHEKSSIEDTQQLHADSSVKLHALSIDVHRKFNKSAERGQQTKVTSEQEQELFKKCLNSGNVQEYKAYIDLFKHQKQEEVQSHEEIAQEEPKSLNL